MSENQTSVTPRLVEQIVTPFIDSIVCGDNVATMRQLPDECIDLTVTSPPYDDLRTYGGHAWDFEAVARELFRVTKKGGVVVWVVADATVDGSETGTSFRQALFFMETGFRLHDTMIYECNKPPLTHKRYEQAFEYMFVFVKAEIKTFNPKMKRNLYFGENCLRNGDWASGKENSAMRQREGEKQVKEFGMQNNIWRYETGGNKTTKDRIAFDHPAVFPERLAEDHISSWSNKGDLVLDPFSGSGTTCKMAKKLGRHFIGLEVNPAYVEISNQRLKQEVLCL
mgnify:CR=1 FL=1